MSEKEFYYRNLPHIQPLGGTFFVTYCLQGSIPAEVLNTLKENYEAEKKQLKLSKNCSPKLLDNAAKRYFVKIDECLDNCYQGVHHLRQENVVKIVADSLHFWDNKLLELYAYCIMSNHVHVVFRLFKDEVPKPKTLDKVMHSIKSFSAHECNKVLNLSGQFWQHESYDRLVRDDTELRNILIYVLNNPVKAGLCREMKDWRWSYIKDMYNDIL